MTTEWISPHSIHPDLLSARKLVFDRFQYQSTQPAPEPESSEYGAFTFYLNKFSVKFRSSKITPTKVGQFVTLWKRDKNRITCPHDDTDPFDLFIISVRKENKLGQFVFPKSALIKHGILSTGVKEGKRGFRVYPPWDHTVNKQARETQAWQLKFFLEINNGEALNVERVDRLYSKFAEMNGVTIP